MSSAVFLLVGSLTVLAALGVVLLRNPIRSALCLVAALFLLAVTYVLLDAHLVAAVQIVVYAGAIMVLFLFVIMLLNLREEPRRAGRLGLSAVAVTGAALLFLQLFRLLRGTPGGEAAPAVPHDFGTVEAVASRLFTHFLLAFEITSVLLLVAIVGAVVLAQRKPT